MRQSSPFPNSLFFLRAFIKACILILILNGLFIVANVDPLRVLMSFNTQWLAGHGRQRLLYTDELDAPIPPLETLVAAHTVAFTPKSPDEFRVFILGDSQAVGADLTDDETLSTQLTRRNIKINGKRVVVYNLGYYGPATLRNLLTLDAVLQYKPDLVIWPISLADLPSIQAASPYYDPFVIANQQRLEQLTRRYGMGAWYDKYFPKQSGLSKWISIQSQVAIPGWIAALQFPFETNIEHHANARSGYDDLDPQAAFYAARSDISMPDTSWQFIKIGQQLCDEAGVPLFVYNEPILISKGLNSDVNYNSTYERAFYDRGRQLLEAYMQQLNIWYQDFYDVIPTENFTNVPLHADAEGLRYLVDRIEGEVIHKYKTVTNSVSIQFDQPFTGHGWTAPEPEGGWTTTMNSTLDLPFLDPSKSYHLKFSVAYSVKQSILDSLQLKVNGQPVELTSLKDNSGTTNFDAVIPQKIVVQNLEDTQLEFDIAEVVSPKEVGLNNDSRKLGVLFTVLRVEPQDIQTYIQMKFDQPFSGSGWTAPSPAGSWTTTTSSVLNLPLLDPSQSYYLQLSVSLQSRILDSLRMKVNGDSIELTSHTDNKAENRIIEAIIPRDSVRKNLNHTQLEFDLAEPPAASVAGQGEDDLLPGILVNNLYIEPRIVQNSVEVKFDQPFNGSGWTESSPIGSWTNTTASSLYLPGLSPTQSYSLNFTVTFSLKQSIVDSLNVKVNGEPVTLVRQRDSSGVTSFHADIPREVILQHLKFTLVEFDVAEVVAPRDVGFNADARKLGVLLSALTIEPQIHQTNVRMTFDQPFDGIGWTGPSSVGSWTTTTASTLNLPSLDPSQTYKLKFSVAFSPKPSILDSLQVRVNGQNVVLSSQHDVTGLTDFEATIPRSVIAVNSRSTQVEFDVAEVIAPRDVGLNDDERKLGILLTTLTVAPQTIQTNIQMTFDQPFDGTGWAGPSAIGSWTTSTASTLNLPPLAVSQSYDLKFVVAFSPKPSILDSLQVRVNGYLVPFSSRHDRNGLAYFEAVIPRSVIAVNATTVQVEFDVAEVVAPRDVGLNNDDRKLGVLLRSLSIGPSLEF